MVSKEAPGWYCIIRQMWYLQSSHQGFSFTQINRLEFPRKTFPCVCNHFPVDSQRSTWWHYPLTSCKNNKWKPIQKRLSVSWLILIHHKHQESWDSITITSVKSALWRVQNKCAVHLFSFHFYKVYTAMHIKCESVVLNHNLGTL